MKKITTALFMSALFIGCLSLTSCKDDNQEFNFDYDDSKETELLDGSVDLSNGRNVFLLDVDNLPEILTKVASRKNIILSIENEEEFPYHLELTRDESGDNHLLLKGLKESVTPLEPGEVRPFMVNLATADGRQKKQIRVTFRKSASSGSSKEEINTNYYETIGKTMLPWTEYGGTVNTVIDANYAAHADKLSITPQLDQIMFDYGGSRYEETMEQFSFQVGGSFKGPNAKIKGKKFVFSGGLNIIVDGTENSIQNTEYYVSLVGKIMSKVKYDPGNIDSKDSATYISNAMLNSDFLNSYTDSVLNLKGTPNYASYSNSKEDIFKLLQRFGTHVICSGAFGGSYIRSYSRYENAYQTTIGCDVSAEIKAQQDNEKVLDKWFQIWEKKNSNYLDFKTDFGYYSSEYSKATKVNSFSKARGGGVVSTDFEVWDNSFTTDNTDGWVIVSYKTSATDTISNLVPIYEFIYEPERRKAVYDNFEAFVEDYSKKYPTKPEWTLILADVMFESISDGSHKSPHGESFTGYPIGADENHPVLYVPMMANYHFPVEDDRGYALETCQNTFLTSSAWGAHYWYYALGYQEMGINGIKDIRLIEKNKDSSFFKDEEKKGNIWQPRSKSDSHSNSDVGLTINNNLFYILPAESTSTPVEQKVKGFALYVPDEVEDNDFVATIFSTTGGCEWQRGWFSTNYSDFKDYWNKNDGTVVRHSEDLFYEHGNGAILKHQFAPIVNYNKLPIQTKKNEYGDLIYGSGDFVGKIQAPLKWGENFH